jgi:hypothetical protein
VGGKTYSVRGYGYQNGDRLTVVGLSEWPGHPAGPAFVAMYRLPNRDRLSFTGQSGSFNPGDKIYFQQKFTPAGGDEREIRYLVKDEPPTEQWSLDGKLYATESGRLTLTDLTKKPPEVNQVRVDLAELIPATEVNETQFKAGLEKLRERSEKVHKFLEPGR